MAQPQRAIEIERPLPQNVDAERAILGAILLDNSAIDKAGEKMTVADFFHDHHKKLFHAMVALREAGQAIDLLTLTEKMQARGELDSVGGAAYVSQLMDGVPHITNVAHYAAIVHEKAQLRDLIHYTAAIQQKAFEAITPPAELYSDLDTIVRLSSNGNGHGRPKLNLTTQGEVSLMNLKPATFVIDPILPVQGLGMLYSKRGMGKTYVALEIAHCVAIGATKCFSWTVPQARPVLYVDGEMPANRMQERLRGIILGHGSRMPEDPQLFRIITPDLQERGVFPNIATREGQNMIEEHMKGDELLVLDNLSCLCRSGKENEGDDWVPVAEWALRLRQRGIAVLFIHHAGKGGEQRGTSRREDLLDCVIAMRPAAEHSASEGLRCEIHIEKLRNSGAAEAVYPFELTMQTTENGAVMWLQRPLKEVIEYTALKMYAEGMSIRDVAEELHISKRRAHQIKNSGVKLPH
jgi:hypothetical protein